MNIVEYFNPISSGSFIQETVADAAVAYSTLCKSFFPKFNYRHSELIVNYNICFKESSATRHIRTCILW